MRKTEGPSWPGVPRDSAEHAARKFAKRMRSRLMIDTSELKNAENYYVCWIDIMGASALMSTSIQKASNAIARIHLALDISIKENGFSGEILPINDGVFIVTNNKTHLTNVVRGVYALLSGNFVAKPSPPERFLIRAGIAFGPVYFGKELADCLSAKRRRSGGEACLSRVMLGSPIAQAYMTEREAPPYGVAVHESARAFAPNNTRPFQIKIWRWWDNSSGFENNKFKDQLGNFGKLLAIEIDNHLNWIKDNLVYNDMSIDKIDSLILQNREHIIGRRKMPSLPNFTYEKEP